MQRKIFYVLAGLLFMSAMAYGQSGEVPTAVPDGKARVVEVCIVTPDTLSIRVYAGDILFGKIQPYTAQPGDQLPEDQTHHNFWLVRNGKTIGAMSGTDRKQWWNFDEIVGQNIDLKKAMDVGSYHLSSTDDATYAVAQNPTAVYRKSKPRNLARTQGWPWLPVYEHWLYLKFPGKVASGKTYTLDLASLALPSQTMVFAPAKLRSEAVHVNQEGFRPDDPIKRGYLSLWMGDGGAADYAPGPKFQVIDQKTGKVVFSSQARLGLSKETVEDAYKRNHNHADVYWMDFSQVVTPGTYRVVVEGIGCSYPFKVDATIYDKAFYVSARGLYHQRSGIELRPPYTTFTRPRCFNPEDGVTIFQSDCPLMDTANGLNLKKTDTDNFGNLVKGATTQIVPDAWGGYFDAGDWDRRIQHLASSKYLLELAELFPAHFDKVNLNIPESGNGLPDVVNEALWGLEVFRRLQLPDGGIRGGIESAEHPWAGDTSWRESHPIYAYAPDEWSSYEYAAIASQAAYVLKKYNLKLSGQWQQSATRAFEYAEKRTEAGSHYAHFAIRDSRNHAAVELWRLTGDNRYHQIFLQSTLMKQGIVIPWVWEQQDQVDATFLYARLDLPGQDAKVKANCLASFLKHARGQPVDGQGFNWTKLNLWGPANWGVMSVPRPELVRAYWLSKDEWYLRSAVLNCQATLGGNPVNISYTVGLGHDWPKNPLICDMRIGNLPPFPGITVGGPSDPVLLKDYFALKLCGSAIYPEISTWPMADAFFDVFLFPAETEYTLDSTIAPHAYVMGFLAARK